MHNSAFRLENSDNSSDTGSVIQPGIVLPATVINGMGTSTDTVTGVPVAEKNEPVNSVKWVDVVQRKLQPNMEVLTKVPAPKKL